jgi:hypothetical protein
MARIIVQAVHGDGQPRRWTLSERIISENLLDNHYGMQLLERLRWATTDAAALELHTPGSGSSPRAPRPTTDPMPHRISARAAR